MRRMVRAFGAAVLVSVVLEVWARSFDPFGQVVVWAPLFSFIGAFLFVVAGGRPRR